MASISRKCCMSGYQRTIGKATCPVITQNKFLGRCYLSCNNKRHSSSFQYHIFLITEITFYDTECLDSYSSVYKEVGGSWVKMSFSFILCYVLAKKHVISPIYCLETALHFPFLVGSILSFQ